VTIKVEGMTPDENALTNELFNTLEQKRHRNILRTKFYDAKNALTDPSKTMPPSYKTLGLVLGWSAKAVDLLSRRANLDGFVWPDGDIESLGFSEVWDGNMLGSETTQGTTSSLIHSTSFVVTTAGGKNEPPALVHFKSALDATGEWDSRTRRLTSLLSITERDPDTGEPIGFALYTDNLTITAARDGLRKWSVVDRQKHTWGVPADPLPYRPRLGRPFGSSRISRPLMSIQCQAVRELYRLEGHMDVFSWPEYWMLGADESIFVNEDGTPKAQWQVMLGRIKGIPDDEDAQMPRADVEQFAAAAPDPHLAALNAFAKLFAREASLPDTSLAITDVSNPTSAESYDASQYELIAEAEGATDDWSPGLRRAMTRALAIANGEKTIPDSWLSIDTQWRDPRYLSRSAQADAGMKQIAAVPWLAETSVGLELLGLSESQRKRALAEKRRMEAAGVLERLAQAAPEPAPAPEAEQPPEEEPQQ
jgi:hypothetical protein